MQSVRQLSPGSPQPCGKTAQQAAYRSRLSRQAEALLRKQAAGKYLDNTAKRIIIRYQRQQRRAIGGVA